MFELEICLTEMELRSYQLSVLTEQTMVEDSDKVWQTADGDGWLVLSQVKSVSSCRDSGRNAEKNNVQPWLVQGHMHFNTKFAATLSQTGHMTPLSSLCKAGLLALGNKNPHSIFLVFYAAANVKSDRIVLSHARV